MMKTLICLFLLTLTTLAGATTLRPLSLQQLSTRADLIFYGKAIDNETRRDPQSGQIVTLTRFRVIDAIKGKAVSGDIHTIKQLGGALSASGQRLMVHGVPQFVPGREYVVFLPQPSRLGFCSPLGLRQGSFNVVERNGERIVSNGNALRTVPAAPADARAAQVPLAVQAGAPSRARLDDFINTVRAYNSP